MPTNRKLTRQERLKLIRERRKKYRILLVFSIIALVVTIILPFYLYFEHRPDQEIIPYMVGKWTPQKKEKKKVTFKPKIKKKKDTGWFLGIPSAQVFNLTCYSYALRRCIALHLSKDVCTMMVKAAALVPADKDLKACKQTLLKQVPLFKRAMLKEQQKQAKQQNPNKTKEVVEQHVVAPQNKPRLPDLPISIKDENGNKKELKKYIVHTNISESKSAEDTKTIEEIYKLMLEVQRDRHTYVGTPVLFKRKLERLRALVNKTHDKTLVKAYNDMIRSMMGSNSAKTQLESPVTGIEEQKNNIQNPGLELVKEKLEKQGIKPNAIAAPRVQEDVSSAPTVGSSLPSANTGGALPSSSINSIPVQ